MSSKNMSKLKKMKMPEAKKGEEEMEGMEDMPMELGAEEGLEGEEMALELPPMGEEGEASAADPAMMEALSDDDLIAELKKRGLMGKLNEEEGSEEYQEDENSIMA